MALPAFVQPLAAQFPEVGAFYTALSPSGRYFMFPHFADENESEVSLWIADLEEQRLYDTEYLLSAPFHPWTALTEQIATWSEDSEQLLVGPRPEELALIKIASPIEESTSIHLLSELPSGTHFIVEDTTENLELILTTTSLGSEITYYLVDTNDGDEPTSRVIDIPLSTARFCGHETLILVSSSNALLVTNLATDETETLASTEELGLSGPNQIHRISISPSLEYAYVYHQNASNPRANAILWSVDLTEYLNPIPCYSAE
jgi:hypothetical protein